jgi:hypothetical protein
MLKMEMSMNTKWSVLAAYENPSARQLAMEFCDGLVQRFWPELSFELHWYEWSDLEKPGEAKEAAHKAIESQIMILAMGHRGAISPGIKRWIELALHGRRDREGVLVGLPVPQSGLTAEAASTQVYLRKLAHQSGLDYLTEVPQGLPLRIPESAESYRMRATQVTSVLDTILHQTPRPRML